jgi:hypothetical protein
MTGGNIEGIFWAPTPVYSGLRQRIFQRKLIGPIGEALGLAAIGHPFGVPFISRLRGHGSPATVRRLVIAINIQALKGQAIRRFTHIRNKALEGSPTITNRNAPGSVFAPCARTRGKATPHHGRPATISFGHFATLGATVRGASASLKVLHLPATARARLASPQVVRNLSHFFAAVAATKPSMLANSLLVRIPNNEKPPEALASYIYHSSHTISLSCILSNTAKYARGKYGG